MTDLVRPRTVRPILQAQVEQELQAVFDRSRPLVDGFGPELSELWALMARQLHGGKLVRPMLVVDVCDAMGDVASPASRTEVIRIAAAVEILHFAFLLHDDVIDGDRVRRGRPNLIGELARRERDGGRPGAAAHWAQSAGILAGDLLLSSAHQLFARVDVRESVRRRLLDLLECTVFETTAGEFTDVSLADGMVDAEVQTVLRMTAQKTAAYSFVLPLRAATILAGGSRELENRLAAAGAHMGLAYQLRDDLLSTFGDAADHGKDAYSDLREGKETAIIAFARRSASWPRMRAHFGDPHLSAPRGERLREQLRSCGAESSVLRLIDAESAALEQLLRGDDVIPVPVRDVLTDLATRLDGRTS